MYRDLQYNKNQQNNTTWFIIISVMLSLFCVLKVFRGTDTDSVSSGGLWNYISLLYYPIFLFTFAKKSKFHIVTIFVSSFMYIIIAVLTSLINPTTSISINTTYQYLMIPYSMLVLFTFYICSRETVKGEKIILTGYFICLALNVYSVLMFRFGGGVRAMESDIYFSLCLFPFALQFIKSKGLKICCILFEFIGVFMVNKRVALISFVIALIAYTLVNTWVNNKSKFTASVRTIIIVSVIVVAVYYISMYFDNKYNLDIYYRLFRLSEDGGSGRDDIYINIWHEFKRSRFMQQLFGHGLNAAGRLGGTGKAHNDFLQILYDYGVFAFLMIVLFYCSLIKEGICFIKNRSPYAATFILSLIIALFLSMFSYCLVYYTYVTGIVAFWGYVLAMEKTRLSTVFGEKL